jgi:hypothetical protein
METVVFDVAVEPLFNFLSGEYAELFARQLATVADRLLAMRSTAGFCRELRRR